MFWLIHLLAGMLIGASTNSILLIVCLALASHFLLDMIPHWDGFFDKDRFEKLGTIKIKKGDANIRGIDVVITVSLFLFFYISFNNKLIVLGALFAMLPDFVKVGYITKLRHNKYYLGYLKFHSKIQGRAKMLTGLITQFITFLFLAAVLLKTMDGSYFTFLNPVQYYFKSHWALIASHFENIF